MDQLTVLTRTQGELTGRMMSVEKDVTELREEFKDMREWMVSRFEDRDKAITENFNSVKQKLDAIKTENEQQVSFYHGAKWVALAIGGVLIWALDHIESIVDLFKASKPS